MSLFCRRNITSDIENIVQTTETQASSTPPIKVVFKVTQSGCSSSAEEVVADIAGRGTVQTDFKQSHFYLKHLGHQRGFYCSFTDSKTTFHRVQRTRLWHVRRASDMEDSLVHIIEVKESSTAQQTNGRILCRQGQLVFSMKGLCNEWITAGGGKTLRYLGATKMIRIATATTAMTRLDRMWHS